MLGRSFLQRIKFPLRKVVNPLSVLRLGVSRLEEGVNPAIHSSVKRLLFTESPKNLMVVKEQKSFGGESSKQEQKSSKESTISNDCQMAREKNIFWTLVSVGAGGFAIWVEKDYGFDPETIIISSVIGGSLVGVGLWIFAWIELYIKNPIFLLKTIGCLGSAVGVPLAYLYWRNDLKEKQIAESRKKDCEKVKKEKQIDDTTVAGGGGDCDDDDDDDDDIEGGWSDGTFFR